MRQVSWNVIGGGGKTIGSDQTPGCVLVLIMHGVGEKVPQYFNLEVLIWFGKA